MGVQGGRCEFFALNVARLSCMCVSFVEDYAWGHKMSLLRV